MSLGKLAVAAMLVFVPAGAMALTRRGVLRNSTASHRVSCTTPPKIVQLVYVAAGAP
jgi:hypothetical protein